MSDMAERVARAIWEQRRADIAKLYPNLVLDEWGDGSVPRLNGVFEEARVAIEAMREPTDAMCVAAEDLSRVDAGQQGVDQAAIWRAMIDEALRNG